MYAGSRRRRGRSARSRAGSGLGPGFWLALGCLGAAGLVGAAALVGGLLFVQEGMDLFTQQVKEDLRDHPVIVEHLGDLEELKVDYLASAAEPGPEDFVFRARGTRGNGVVTATCVTVDAETERVVAGTLKLDSGEVFDLFPAED